MYLYGTIINVCIQRLAFLKLYMYLTTYAPFVSSFVRVILVPMNIATEYTHAKLC